MHKISKTRLYVENNLSNDCVIGLNPNKSHYLRAVLRLQIGDDVILFNGIDGEWLALIDVKAAFLSGLRVDFQN